MLWIGYYDDSGEERVYSALGYFDTEFAYHDATELPDTLKAQCKETGIPTYLNTEHSVSSWFSIQGQYEATISMPDDYNTFTIQKRAESGDFEVVYTITPRHPSMELHAAGHASDGTWLLLQNEEYCEIYDLATGTLAYELQKPDNRTAQYAVINGRLHSFTPGWNPEGIPLPDLQQARAYIRASLHNGSTRRTLTEAECRTYYIPDGWENK